jgi:hypothetical protein
MIDTFEVVEINKETLQERVLMKTDDMLAAIDESKRIYRERDKYADPKIVMIEVRMFSQKYERSKREMKTVCITDLSVKR